MDEDTGRGASRDHGGLYRPSECPHSCRNRLPRQPGRWCDACLEAEAREFDERDLQHELVVATARHAMTVPASDREWWEAIAAALGAVEDEGKDASEWGPWADLYVLVGH